MSDDALRWSFVRTTGATGEFKVFSVDQHLAEHPETGEARLFSVIHTADWVNIIALTPDDEVVLVRQFRHGTGEVTLEIPGGMLDAGESYLEAGARELREETGYTAERWVELGVVEPNSAIQDNRCATVLALDARRTAAMELDAGEVIEVATRPLSEIGEAIRSGEISHALVVAAFMHLTVHAGGLRRP